MMMIADRTRMLQVVTLALCAAPFAAAQGKGADRPVNALATKQQMIEDRLARLEDRMFRLREKLAETEPESARKLEAGLKEMGKLDLDARMQKLVELLGESSRLPEAAREQKQMLADIDELLNVLLDRNPMDEERRKQLQRMEDVRRELEDLLNQQENLRRSAADAVRAKRAAQQLDAALKKLDDILQRQQQLAERTAPSAEQTNPPTLQGGEEGGSENQQQSSQSEATSESESQKPADQQRNLAEETERLSREVKRIDQRTASPDEGKQEESDPSEDLNAGADAMKRAGDQLDAGKQKEAKEAQKEAIENLRRARLRLQEKKEQLEEQPATPEGGAQRQRDLADRAGKLAQRMRGEGEQGENGDQQQQQEGSPSDQQQPQPMPGNQRMDQAEKHMRDAGEDLDKSQTEDAIEDQDKALNDLEEARRELEDVLRQMRKEEQEVLLKNIESRLQEMLAQQKSINDETAPLAATGSDNLTRAETLACVQLADRQGEVADGADTCVRLLEEDGTSIVFTTVIGRLADDMRDVAGRLTKADVGKLTVAMQAEILSSLEELAAAVKQVREDHEKQQGMPMAARPGMTADAPLVPTSAELRMLKASQKRINEQTLSVAESETIDQAEEQANRTILEHAAERQAELVKMARELQERAEKEGGS